MPRRKPKPGTPEHCKLCTQFHPFLNPHARNADGAGHPESVLLGIRYDEIIHLRMLLLDILNRMEEIHGEDFDSPRVDHVFRVLKKDAKRYGAKGDCV